MSAGFYKASISDTGEFEVLFGEKVFGSGWSLDVDREGDLLESFDGWVYFENEREFLETVEYSDTLEYAKVLRVLEEANVDLSIISGLTVFESEGPWVEPVGIMGIYPLGALVSHGGKLWESLIEGNVWEPGVSGWREIVSDGYPEWVQPSGAHDAYEMGSMVSYAGSDWVSIVDNNVWAPGIYGWELL